MFPLANIAVELSAPVIGGKKREKERGKGVRGKKGSELFLK
jgi:hypothetical protein